MRHPRLVVDGAWYHVTARVNRREMLLDRGEVRDLFLVFLTRAKKLYRFQVINFCVMGNHIHLMVQPGAHESLSAIMRWLLGGFARAYNKKRGLTGHFWGDRFHSRVLRGLRQIAIAFGYIDANPEKAGLVADSCYWPHGGAWHSRMGDLSILDPAPPWLAFLGFLRAMPVGLGS
jgi:putative transposase